MKKNIEESHPKNTNYAQINNVITTNIQNTSIFEN